jgi:hypothetical protein
VKRESNMSGGGDMTGSVNSSIRGNPVIFSKRARVAELADALDSKSSGRKAVMVRFHSRAPLPFCYGVYSKPPKADFRFISLHSFAQATVTKAA